MYEVFWYLFTETGNVSAYLVYKSLRALESERNEEGGKGNPVDKWL